VALDNVGQLLGELSFTASAAGYAKLCDWAMRLVASQEVVFGVEGIGSWAPASAITSRQPASTSLRSSVRVAVIGARASRTASMRSRREERAQRRAPLNPAPSRRSLSDPRSADRQTLRCR